MSILICRPDPMALNLKHKFDVAGIDAVIWQALLIRLPRDKSDINDFCQSLQANDIIIVVSQFAVPVGIVPVLHDYVEKFKQCQVFAIGRSTAQNLQTLAIDKINYPAMANSEHLLALPELQDVKGKTVWLLRGQSGKELITETLQSRGAKVMPVCCYERVYNRDTQSLQQCLAQGVQLILLTSIDALKAFWHAVPQDLQNIVIKTPVTVMSADMLNLAHRLGFKISCS